MVTSCEKYGTRSSLYIIFPREFVFSFGKFAKKHERALMSADARERKTFFLFRTCALALTLRVFLPSRSAKISSSFIRTSFNGTIITVSTKMVYSLPCFFVCFIFFCLRSVLCVLRACFLSKQDKNARAYSFLKRAQVCDGVDTVIVFARIFGAHFFVSFLTFQ